MSALKSDFQPLFEEAVTKLEPPWSLVLHSLDQTPQHIMDIIGHARLDISGVFVKGQQYTLEKIAARFDGDVSHFLYVIYGLVMTCTTGELHEHLARYARHEWIPWLLKANIAGEPAFIVVCKRSLKSAATWMVGALNECSNFEPLTISTKEGDTALHIAIRKGQWEWAVWLVDNGVSPYQKNKKQESPIMLMAPHHTKIELFKVNSLEKWHNALHDALIYGKCHPEWCEALLNMGADVNQPELYDAPLESLQLFANHGMDMNLGPLPENITTEQRHVFYLNGHVPKQWELVMGDFNDEWPAKLYALHFKQQVPEEMVYSLTNRKALTPETLNLQHYCPFSI